MLVLILALLVPVLAAFAFLVVAIVPVLTARSVQRPQYIEDPTSP